MAYYATITLLSFLMYTVYNIRQLLDLVLILGRLGFMR